MPTLAPPTTQPPVTQPPVTQAPVITTAYPVDPVDPVDPIDPVDPDIKDPNLPDIDPPYVPPVTTTTQAPAPLRRQCGRRNQGGIGVRIQNSDNDYKSTTQFGEWPHMCAILKKGEVGGKEVNFYVGGASLIHPGIVLTAAHIV